MSTRAQAMELQLELQHRAYRAEGLAWVRKTEPAVKAVGGVLKYVGKGPPDFIGFIADGGRGVVFDAKSTRAARWQYKWLKDHQARDLGEALDVGAHAFLVIKYGGGPLFMLPWSMLREEWWAWRKATGTTVSIADDDHRLVPLDGADWLATLEVADVRRQEPLADDDPAPLRDSVE